MHVHCVASGVATGGYGGYMYPPEFWVGGTIDQLYPQNLRNNVGDKYQGVREQPTTQTNVTRRRALPFLGGDCCICIRLQRIVVGGDD